MPEFSGGQHVRWMSEAAGGEQRGMVHRAYPEHWHQIGENCPARTKPRTDLERFADGMEWLDLTLMRIMYEKVAS